MWERLYLIGALRREGLIDHRKLLCVPSWPVAPVEQSLNTAVLNLELGVSQGLDNKQAESDLAGRQPSLWKSSVLRR